MSGKFFTRVALLRLGLNHPHALVLVRSYSVNLPRSAMRKRRSTNCGVPYQNGLSSYAVTESSVKKGGRSWQGKVPTKPVQTGRGRRNMKPCSGNLILRHGLRVSE